MVLSYCSHTEDGEKVYTVELTEDEFNSLEALGEDATEALREATLMKSVCMAFNEDFADIVHRVHSMSVADHILFIHFVKEYMVSKVGPDVPDDEAVKAHLKHAINSVYGADAAKAVHPDEDCVLPGCDRYGGNDTYLRIRKVLGHKGAFDFCMGNVIKLVDRWEKKGDPAQNLEKLRDYSAQALVEWRLWNEKLS